MDRNFRYARQERLSRKTVRSFSTERPYPRDEFLPVMKRGVGSGLPVSIDQVLLWGERAKEHRPCRVLQVVFGRLSGEHHQRPQTYRPLFATLGHPLFYRLRYRRGTAVAQYDKQNTTTLSRICFRRNLYQ